MNIKKVTLLKYVAAILEPLRMLYPSRKNFICRCRVMPKNLVWLHFFNCTALYSILLIGTNSSYWTLCFKNNSRVRGALIKYTVLNPMNQSKLMIRDWWVGGHYPRLVLSVTQGPNDLRPVKASWFIRRYFPSDDQSTYHVYHSITVAGIRHTSRKLC